MNTDNKRNTSKEKQNDNKGFPYHRLKKGSEMFNKLKYELTDEEGNSYGKFREKVNADKEIKRLKQEEFHDDIGIERL